MMSSLRARLPLLSLGALVMGLLACTGYWMLFTVFMSYDDEGYILWSARQFCDGHALYTEVYSQYGPMFYAWYRLWDAVGLVFNNDSARWLTLAYWLIAAGACGSMVWRLTRRSLPAMAAVILSFAALQEIIREPFHPGGFLVAITAVGTAVCLAALLRPANRAFAITAALVGTAMALIKINVGVFFFIAAGSWVALNFTGRKWGWAALGLTALGVAAAPVALMKAQLASVLVRDFALVFAASGLAVLVAAWAARRAEFTGRHLLWMILTAGLVTGSMVAFGAATGTSVASLWDGVVIAPLRHPDLAMSPVPWRAGVVPGTILALVIALLQFARAPLWRSTAIAWLRVLGGLTVLAQLTGFGFERPLQAVFQFAPALAWLMATPLTAGPEPDPAARGRSWIAWCAVWQTLQAYPIAGSQMAWGSFLFVPLLVAGSYEAICFLRQHIHRPQLASPVASGALLGLAALANWHLGNEALAVYLDREPLDLPGARSLRLPGTLTSEFRIMSRNIVAHSDLLFSAPGMFSFNIWTQKPTPTAANVTIWGTYLDDAQKEAIATRLLQDKSSMLVVRSADRMLYDPTLLLPSFRPAVFVGNYSLWISQDTTILPLGTVRFEKAADGRPFLVIVAAPTKHRIAGLQLREAERHEAGWQTGIPAGRGWRITPVNLQAQVIGETKSETQPFVLPEYSLVQIAIDPALKGIQLNKAEIALIDTDGAVVETYRFDKLPAKSAFTPR